MHGCLKIKLPNASMIFFHILMCFLLLFIPVFVQGNKEIFTLNKTVKNLLHHIGGFLFCFVFNTHKKKKKKAAWRPEIMECQWVL